MSRTRIPLSREEERLRHMSERFEMSTAEIGLTVRTTNCLEEKGILTVRDLLNSRPEDLLDISNFGENILEEVYKSLERFGFFRTSPALAVAGCGAWEVEVDIPELACESKSQQPIDRPPDAPIGIDLSIRAFRRELPSLLRSHQGKWVAFNRDAQNTAHATVRVPRRSLAAIQLHSVFATKGATICRRAAMQSRIYP